MADEVDDKGSIRKPMTALEHQDYQHKVARRQKAEINLYQLDIILASINHACFAIKSICEAIEHQKILTNEYSKMHLQGAMVDIEQAYQYVKQISLEVTGSEESD